MKIYIKKNYNLLVSFSLFKIYIYNNKTTYNISIWIMI